MSGPAMAIALVAASSTALTFVAGTAVVAQARQEAAASADAAALAVAMAAQRGGGQGACGAATPYVARGGASLTGCGVDGRGNARITVQHTARVFGFPVTVEGTAVAGPEPSSP